MISGRRKTIGVFICKAYSLFDNAVYHALEEEAKKHDFDVIIFTTVGYFSSQNDYDTQEQGMFAFAPIEQLDGIIVAPDTYEIEGFRDQLHAELTARAKCPVVSIRHLGEGFDCIYTDEDLALRPLLKHLIEDHGLKRISFLAVMPREDIRSAERYMADFRNELETLNKRENRTFDVEASCGAVVFRLNGLSTIEECIQKSDEAMYLEKEKRHARRTD